jgi:sec-independent protein translocase protein TatB
MVNVMGPPLVPMFIDIGAPELLMLAVIAVVVFGPEKLPEFARKAAKALRYVRQMAGSAQTQLRSELGPDFEDLDFADLNPKAFVRKHLLSDVEPVVSDVKNDLNDVASLGRGTVGDATAAIENVKDGVRRPVELGGGVTAKSIPVASTPAHTPYDPDAT